jgi:hypothetical protein
LRSKLGLYCGDVVEINHPLLPIGMKTPSSMGLTSPLRYTAPAFSHAALANVSAKAVPNLEMADWQRLRQPHGIVVLQWRATARGLVRARVHA